VREKDRKRMTGTFFGEREGRRYGPATGLFKKGMGAKEMGEINTKRPKPKEREWKRESIVGQDSLKENFMKKKK